MLRLTYKGVVSVDFEQHNFHFVPLRPCNRNIYKQRRHLISPICRLSQENLIQIHQGENLRQIGLAGAGCIRRLFNE